MTEHPQEQPPSGPSGQQPPQPQMRLPIPSVRPMLTYWLLGINVAIFVLGLIIDLLFGGSTVLLAYGAKANAEIVAGQYWRFITPMFLHIGLIHLAFNSYFLYIIGPQVERPFGYMRFFLIYMGAGVTSSVLSMIASPSPSAGASGALFGIIGALGVYLYQNREMFGAFGKRRLNGIRNVILINLLFGLSPGIDNWGHVGGLIGGVVFAALIGPHLEVRPDFADQPHVVDANPLSEKWWAAGLFGAGTVAAAIAAILIRS